ncbi:MAG: TIGR04282 family arsenosugar biosynthesis glycosyltransferase [Gammaproteobacteria bacterium]|nr:TIGR04282 family arsenosugar biosynthesis glycosyltransferase [Gammaproteobacteria bacterium]
MKNPDLLLFARHPIPGQSKTRLQSVCGPEKAAEISEFLIRTSCQNAVENWPGDVFLYGSPDSNHPVFQSLAQELHIVLKDQGSGDLGQKMASAMEYHINRKGAAAIMGIDIPHCPGEVIEKAYDFLADDESVIGPTDDGGYYLIGLAVMEQSLFKDIAWGTASVLKSTMDKASQASITFELLPMLKDIDTWDDLWLVSQVYEPLKQFVAD